MTKDRGERSNSSLLRPSSFDILSSFVLRHSPFTGRLYLNGCQ
jgi:hypothetical protein